MERSWMHARVARPTNGVPTDHSDTLSTVVPALVAQLRDADPDGHWYFNRPPDRHLDLGFYATDPLLAELDGSLRACRPCATSGRRRPWITDAAHVGTLAEVGSDLALAFVAAGGLPEQAELPLAVEHLRDLLQLVYVKDRLGFLSMYWQHQARSLTPAARQELALVADTEAEKIVMAADELCLPPELAAAWHPYLDTVHTVIERRTWRGDEPSAYLLFHHLRLTHERLGLTPDVDALAALALRIAMGRAEGRPVARVAA